MSTLLPPPYFMRPQLRLGVMHSFETTCPIKALWRLFLLVSTTHNHHTDTLLPLCPSGSHHILWCQQSSRTAMMPLINLHVILLWTANREETASLISNPSRPVSVELSTTDTERPSAQDTKPQQIGRKTQAWTWPLVVSGPPLIFQSPQSPPCATRGRGRSAERVGRVLARMKVISDFAPLSPAVTEPRESEREREKEKEREREIEIVVRMKRSKAACSLFLLEEV